MYSPSTVYFSIIILIMSNFLVLLSSANYVDQRYTDCIPTTSSCGFQWKIAYPFWDSRQHDYCGHPAFELKCNQLDNNHSSLTIGINNQTYNILHLNYEAKVFTLSNPLFSVSPCPTSETWLTNTNLDTNLFNFSSDSQNVTLFYDCDTPSFDADPPSCYAFTCEIGTSYSEPSSAYYTHSLAFLTLNDSTWEQKQLETYCGFWIHVPVLKSAAADLYNGRSAVETVLAEGFDVEWMTDEDGYQCQDCSESGGRCGYDHTLNHPVCFCKDGPHDRTCGSTTALSLVHKTSTGRTRNWKIITGALVIIATLIITSIMYCLWRCIGKRATTSDETLLHSMIEADFQDLPLLEFEKLAMATNNFEEKNKLGQGGFGPVYKGKLENGKEVAVKRLSRASGQGQQEFMNEVILISKLQHKNLVRLLGCCVERDEKLLVYEFMPKKSLDALLFDPAQSELLGWKSRFDIIKGICRGVLYLHRDSRLKIIHRDLKPSNILLDEQLNPKISDFGMARIFGSTQDQANTLRVVGTYGYMSPEYAMEGRFSEKSDVFSVGVLLLEIVCGKRNNIIDDESMSLISYAWKLWNEGNILSLIDSAILDPCFQVGIMRSIHVGLLCVQELPQDRPSISTVISMLDCEVIDLPHPLQPGFTRGRYCPATNDVQQHNHHQNCSVNQVSISSVYAR